MKNLGLFLLCLLVSVCGGFGGAYYYDRHHRGARDAEIPKIAVIDPDLFEAYMAKLSGKGKTGVEIGIESIKKATAAADALSGAGYIVLRREAVYNAPENVVIDPSRIMGTPEASGATESPKKEGVKN